MPKKQMEVILNSGGVTYRHEKAAKTGDLWIGVYNPILVGISKIEDFGGQYIHIIPMTPDIKEGEAMHASYFYSRFKKYEDE